MQVSDAKDVFLLCRLFEPYVIHVIGKLLNCYSDGNKLVRDGAHAAARVIMANLSGQGMSTNTAQCYASLACMHPDPCHGMQHMTPSAHTTCTSTVNASTLLWS